MENICSFEPMWKSFEADVPQKDITRIRLKSVEVFLRENKFLDTEQPPSLEYIIAASLEIVNHLLCFWQGDNPIIAKIRTIAAQTKSEPIIAVQGAIALWYTSCVSIFVRDIHQGVSSEEEITTFDDGTIIATWNREYAAECHYAGNLGLMAMLLTTETWLPPSDHKLQVASLVSCAATTILFATYMISSRIPAYHSWSFALSACPNNEGVALFLRSAWRLAQRNVDKGFLPGTDFGAHIDEIRLSRNGKILLSKVGRADWARAPFWHPSLLTAVFGEYYSNLRTRFDQANRRRSRLAPDECKNQFSDLAMQTGCEYPYFIPAPETATSVHHLDQEYLYNLPMVKKPVSDVNGNLTLPFLTTAIRALRFGEDPDEIEQNLFMMTFPLTVALPP
ncbi:hypothetical protein THAR02_06404 [Trichoderma harzianum]|uniref:MAT1-1-2 n=1 Tax=Trichoderma harzianum TaxID=5544 RepID=A0A0F9XAF7_TRIHA|nr:hypothetical protein THAR02_06404 [Trichoderma harzianum]